MLLVTFVIYVVIYVFDQTLGNKKKHIIQQLERTELSIQD